MACPERVVVVPVVGGRVLTRAAVRMGFAVSGVHQCRGVGDHVEEREVGQRQEYRVGVGGDDRVAAAVRGVDQDHSPVGGSLSRISQLGWQKEPGETGMCADLVEQRVVLGPQPLAAVNFNWNTGSLVVARPAALGLPRRRSVCLTFQER
jgi:hypothetical protein